MVVVRCVRGCLINLWHLFGHQTCHANTPSCTFDAHINESTSSACSVKKNLFYYNCKHNPPVLLCIMATKTETNINISVWNINNWILSVARPQYYNRKVYISAIVGQLLLLVTSMFKCSITHSCWMTSWSCMVSS